MSQAAQHQALASLKIPACDELPLPLPPHSSLMTTSIPASKRAQSCGDELHWLCIGWRSTPCTANASRAQLTSSAGDVMFRHQIIVQYCVLVLASMLTQHLGTLLVQACQTLHGLQMAPPAEPRGANLTMRLLHRLLLPS